MMGKYKGVLIMNDVLAINIQLIHILEINDSCVYNVHTSIIILYNYKHYKYVHINDYIHTHMYIHRVYYKHTTHIHTHTHTLHNYM